ncbi:MAG: hypothetical protein U0800_02275 [Isosphaeraceae bacterium]
MRSTARIRRRPELLILEDRTGLDGTILASGAIAGTLPPLQVGQFVEVNPTSGATTVVPGITTGPTSSPFVPIAQVVAMASPGDGQPIVVGTQAAIAGTPTGTVVGRLNTANGTIQVLAQFRLSDAKRLLDSASSVAVGFDGTIFVAGLGSDPSGVIRGSFAKVVRIDPATHDATVVTTFRPVTNLLGQVTARPTLSTPIGIAVTSDNRILLGGTAFPPSLTTATGQDLIRVVSIDPAFGASTVLKEFNTRATGALAPLLTSFSGIAVGAGGPAYLSGAGPRFGSKKSVPTVLSMNTVTGATSIVVQYQPGSSGGPSSLDRIDSITATPSMAGFVVAGVRRVGSADQARIVSYDPKTGNPTLLTDFRTMGSNRFTAITGLAYGQVPRGRSIRLSASGDTTGRVGQRLRLDLRTTANGPMPSGPFQYEVNWGEARPSVTRIQSGAKATARHIYKRAGTYRVTAVVKYAGGASQPLTWTITVG